MIATSLPRIPAFEVWILQDSEPEINIDSFFLFFNSHSVVKIMQADFDLRIP